MDRIRLKDKEFELFIPEEEIKDAIAKVAERIREDVKGCLLYTSDAADD